MYSTNPGEESTIIPSNEALQDLLQCGNIVLQQTCPPYHALFNIIDKLCILVYLCDLVGVDLVGVDLVGVDFLGVNLMGVNLMERHLLKQQAWHQHLSDLAEESCRLCWPFLYQFEQL